MNPVHNHFLTRPRYWLFAKLICLFFSTPPAIAQEYLYGNNVKMGPGAGSYLNNSGGANVMIGNGAGYGLTSGTFNVMIGNSAGANSATGSYNTAIGNAAGSANTAGSYNTCIGDGAGYKLNASLNMMLGVHAGFNTTSGASNVMIGLGAGYDNVTGSENTLIGNNANVNADNLTNATAIGANAKASVSNSVILGYNANVGIGTSNPQYKLSVNGTIGAREIKVTANGWADFVFSPGYSLPPLMMVSQHIKRYGHLPGIPSEAEVTVNGIAMGAMQTKLLQKIEELTLYVISQQNEIGRLTRRVNRLSHALSTR